MNGTLDGSGPNLYKGIRRDEKAHDSMVFLFGPSVKNL